MNLFVLEILSEEIPYSLQKKSVELANVYTNNFKDNLGLESCSFEVFHTPIRLIVKIENLPNSFLDKEKKLRGPNIDANEQAILGFMKKHNIKDKTDLVIQKEGNRKYYFLILKALKVDIKIKLKEYIEGLLNILEKNWDRSMRWGENKVLKWARPIKNILALYNEELIEGSFYNYKFTRETIGFKFQKNRNYQNIIDVKSYFDFLDSEQVIYNQNRRKEIIENEIHNILKKKDFRVVENDFIIEELVSLVEYPRVLLGNIDIKYLRLPKEMIIHVLNSSQKYLALEDSHGKLVPFFIFISNVRSTNNDKLIKDNEKVLAAKLNDAEFFCKEDRLVTLADKSELLRSYIFHKHLGTLEDKVKRLKNIGLYIALWVPHAGLENVAIATELQKNDLFSNAIREFPDLQGVIGAYQAEKEGYSPEIVLALREQYYPLPSKSEILPVQPVSIVLSLVDKIDTVVGLFLAGEKPTGSRDPYGLRRATLGFIRIILFNKIKLPMNLLFLKVIEQYDRYLSKEIKARKIDKSVTLKEIEAFFMNRFAYLCLNKGYNKFVVGCAIDNVDQKYNFIDLEIYIINIYEFIKTKKGKYFLEVFKRSWNILKKECLEGGTNPDIGKKLKKAKKYKLKDQYEIDLHKELKVFSIDVQKFEKTKDNYEDIFIGLYKLSEIMDKFLNNVHINVEDKVVYKNRVAILREFVTTVNCIFNFSDFIDK